MNKVAMLPFFGYFDAVHNVIDAFLSCDDSYDIDL